MKAWKHIPGVAYPAAPQKRASARRLRADEPRISTSAIAALFHCTRAHARRLGSLHGGPAARAANPATGKSESYYREAGVMAYYERNAARYATPAKRPPAGHCAAKRAIALAGGYRRLRAAVARGQVRSAPGHSPSGKCCIYYNLADLAKLANQNGNATKNEKP